MRTTIDINDELLKRAKAYAVSERKTLKTTVEQALRVFLATPDDTAVVDAPSIPVFQGQGVQPGVNLTDNGAVVDAPPIPVFRGQGVQPGVNLTDNAAVVDTPPIPVFRGQGVQPGVNLTDNAALEEQLDS